MLQLKIYGLFHIREEQSVQSPPIDSECLTLAELNNWMATGRNDFLWRSVLDLVGISRVLNVILWLTATS